MDGMPSNIAVPLILRVAVGSSNPAKIDAVLHAMRQCLDRKETGQLYTMELEGFEVESGVDKQPFGDEATCQGAKNRAYAAYVAYKKKNGHYPHLSVGMEGGVEWISVGQKDEKNLYCMAWMAIYGKRQALTVDVFASEQTASYFGDKKPYYGLGKTACFPLPPKITTLITEDHMELGDADDFLFRRNNSKRGEGTVGILTDGMISRAAYYEHALILALTPWIRPDVYTRQEQLL